MIAHSRSVDLSNIFLIAWWVCDCFFMECKITNKKENSQGFVDIFTNCSHPFSPENLDGCNNISAYAL